MEKLFSTLGSFLSELRRRRVVHVLVVYAVVAGGVIEVSDIVLPALQLPAWTVRLVVVLALAGLPVALVLGWAFDVTPEGIRRTEDLPSDGDEGGHADVRSPRFRMAMTVGVAVVMAAASWVAWAAWLSPSAAGDAAAADDREELSRTRIAVLPLDDHSPNGELRFLADGLTEDLIHQLTQVGALDVVSRYGVQPYGDVEVAFDSVARALDAGSIVEGSVSRSRDSVRVTVQLIDGRTGLHISSAQLQERVTGDLSFSALSLRDRLVEEATRLLRRELGEDIRLEEIRAGTDDPDAWSGYHRASQLLEDARRMGAAGDTAAARRFCLQADSLLERAQREDPDWPAPDVLRGRTALRLAGLGVATRTDLDPEWLRRGIDHANRVLEEHPGHAGALELRGELRYKLSHVVPGPEAARLLEAAEADLREAERAQAWIWLADLLRTQGRLQEALVAARRSRDADPYLGLEDSFFFWLSAQLALDQGEFEEAGRLLERAEQWYPDQPALQDLRLLLLASTADTKSQVDSAWALQEILRRALGRERWRSGEARVAAVLARVGMSDSARAVLRRARSDGGGSTTLDYYAAYARLVLGDTATTLDMLERYIEALPQDRSYIAIDPWWEPLHGDPRFEALVDTTDGPATETSGT